MKNPLAIIQMGLDYLTREHGQKNPATRGVLEDMADAVKRADAIVRELLDLSKPTVGKFAPENPNEVIDAALGMTRLEFDRCGVGVVRDFCTERVAVQMDRAKISQVMVNVFTNACHAMRSGGTLTVRTRTRTIGTEEMRREAGSRRSLRFHPGDLVLELDVEDTGPGVESEDTSILFAPFFTTKPAGEGTGLGLTVARNIVDAHGGTIKLRNRAEGGLRVTMQFKVSNSGEEK